MVSPEHIHEDSEKFFDTLAGRERSVPGADALREALEAEARTVREAEGATAEELSDDERAKMAAIKNRLIEAGLLPAISPVSQPGGAVPNPSPNFSKPVALAWHNLLSGLLSGSDWLRPVAAVASLAIVSLLVIRIELPLNSHPEDVVRGDGIPVITVEDAAATARSLESKLKVAGAEVVLVQINDAEWSLEVSVQEPDRIAPVKQSLQDANVKVSGDPPYYLNIRQRK